MLMADQTNPQLLLDADVDYCRSLIVPIPAHRANLSVEVETSPILDRVEKREENRGRTVTWHVALRPGKRRALPDTESGRWCERIEQIKASVRAKVEHPFHIVKNLFGHKKARYRGLAKNTSQLLTLFGLANLLIAKRRLFALHAQGAC